MYMLYLETNKIQLLLYVIFRVTYMKHIMLYLEINKIQLLLYVIFRVTYMKHIIIKNEKLQIKT